MLLAVSGLMLLSCSSINMVSCNQKIAYKQIYIVSFQPFYTEEGPEPSVEGWELPDGFDCYAKLIQGAGDYLTDNIDTIQYKSCAKQEEYIQPSSFAKLGKNQIIMFEGHGSFVPIVEDEPEAYSVMWTGRDWNATPAPEQDDVDELRIVPAETYHEAITLHFVEKYVNDLSGSIVYLGNCYSGREVTFAQAFLNKGAEAVIGNSDTIQVAYNSLMEYTTIKKLGEINPDTNLPYTIYEALEYAKSIYGKNDKEKYPAARGAEPLLFGNPNFRISK